MCFRIKELCQQFPQGITDQVIQNDMPHLEPQQRAMVINKLLSLVSPQSQTHILFTCKVHIEPSSCSCSVSVVEDTLAAVSDGGQFDGSFLKDGFTVFQPAFYGSTLRIT